MSEFGQRGGHHFSNNSEVQQAHNLRKLNKVKQIKTKANKFKQSHTN